MNLSGQETNVENTVVLPGRAAALPWQLIAFPASIANLAWQHLHESEHQKCVSAVIKHSDTAVETQGEMF